MFVHTSYVKKSCVLLLCGCRWEKGSTTVLIPSCPCVWSRVAEIVRLSPWSGLVLSCPVSSAVGHGDLLLRQVDLAGVPNRHGGRWAMPERAEGLQVPNQLPV